MVDTKHYKIALIILVPILLVSLGINIYNNLLPKYVVGIVDHKSIGTGTDSSGEPVEWYTVSLWLVTKDDVNGFNVGETIAYIVEENSYHEIMVGDVIKATLLKELSIDVLDITRKTSKMVWTRSGGFIGLAETIVINDDGAVSYSSTQFGDGEMAISKDEYGQLIGKLNYFTGDVQFPARQDAADYFIYRVTVQSALGTRVIEWVDSWASQESIPMELDEIGLHFLNLVERLSSENDSIQNASERAVEIAREFLIQAPTFKFDGIPETIKIIETRILESFPIQYVVVIEFDSRHAGYGDRANQTLVQVITNHIAEIKVVSDNVVQAVIDDEWDELNQDVMGSIDGEPNLKISTPEWGRDTALEYVFAAHEELKGIEVPTIWDSVDLTPEGFVGSSKVQFIAHDWTVTISWMIVRLPIYNVEIGYSGDGGFNWNGEVDQLGAVNEIEFSLIK